jgi:hypothetical protein
MKKAFLILVIIILGVGGFYFYSQKNKKPVVRVDSNGQEIVGLRVIQDDSLTGWIKRKKTVQCKVASTEGEITMMVKNDKVRIEGIPYAFGSNSGGNFGVSLTDGDMLYLWDNRENTGVKINIIEINDKMTAAQKSDTIQYSWEESAKNWETAYKYECAEKGLADDLFIPPTGVNFTDMTNNMTDSQAAVKSLQKS